MKKFNKRYALLVIMLTVMVLLSGCTNEKNGVNKEENAKIVAIPLAQLEDGAYIQTNDQIIPFMTQGRAYTEQSITTDNLGKNYRVVWFASQDGLIPEITEEDHFIIKTSNNLPTIPTIFTMEDYGYTIGCTLYKDSNTNLYGISKDQKLALCEGSSFNKNYIAASNTENTRLFDIGGQKITESNVSTIGSITGLEKGKDYPIGLYNGTKYSEITAVCDTHVFVNSFQKLFTASDFQYTKNGYVIIKIPAELPSGYYYFDNVGLFKFTKSNQ